jgi:radical SAM superfamily enzyme YgiQ (UPF0313 family)
VDELGRELAQDGVSLSLPSLRLDSFSGKLAEQLQRVRKSGLTFAPEAGTQRLRDVINKNIKEEDLLSAAADAFGAGWVNIKLYFMIGLPTETDDDLYGIAELARKVVKIYRQAGGRGRLRVTISAAVFVPKAHTPFQWEPQISREEIMRRQKLLKAELRGPGIRFQWHDAETSMLESALARGDRRLSPVLKQAMALGCKLDGWDEHFSYSNWQKAFKENELDLEEYARRGFTLEEPLPWDHLDAGVSKRFLQRELQLARQAVVTADCRTGCLGCGMGVLLKKETNDKGVCRDESLDSLY